MIRLIVRFFVKLFSGSAIEESAVQQDTSPRVKPQEYYGNRQGLPVVKKYL